MSAGPSSFRTMGSSKFESLPDISRKLDTILQLIRENRLARTISSQQQELLTKLEQLQPQVNVSYPPPSDARTTLLQTQQWGQNNLTQSAIGSDPIAAMSSGWGNSQNGLNWTQPVVTEPITVSQADNSSQIKRELRRPHGELSMDDSGILQQIYESQIQLVNQANDNSEMIMALQQGLNEIRLSRNADVDRLIEENDLMRSYLDRVINKR